MKKILTLLIALTVTSSAFAGCKDSKNDDTSETTAETTAETTVASVNENENSQNKTVNLKDLSEEDQKNIDMINGLLNPEIKNTYVEETPENFTKHKNKIANDFTIVENSYYIVDNSLNSYSKITLTKVDKKTCMKNEVKDQSSRFVYDGDSTVAIIQDSVKQYTNVAASEFTSEMGIDMTNVGNIDIYNYVETSDVIVNGKEMTREKLALNSGELYWFYFEDNLYASLFSIDDNKVSCEFVNEIKSNGDESLVEIPEEYTELNL